MKENIFAFHCAIISSQSIDTASKILEHVRNIKESIMFNVKFTHEMHFVNKANYFPALSLRLLSENYPVSSYPAALP